MRMTRDRLRTLTWILAILAPATFAIAAGMKTAPNRTETVPVSECGEVVTPIPYAPRGMQI